SRLPVSFYDANKTGNLVARIMSDVEGVRNLLGTGLVELAGGLLTSLIALVVLFRISALMTVLAFGFLLCFAIALNKAFSTIRPIFRERGKINAEVTGRLAESLGGVRVIKGYHAEEREEAVFATGVRRLLENVMRTQEILHERPEDQDPNRTLTLTDIAGRVEFDDVSFSYDGNRTVLHNVSFVADPGTVTALVGSSGSGKSTTIGLITAFHVPTQ